MLNLYHDYLEEKFVEQQAQDRLHKASNLGVRSRRAAFHQFDRAVRRAWFRSLLARFSRRETSLPSWRELELQGKVSNRRYKGLEQVALADIVGSVDRSCDFDAHYYPKAAHMRERWVRVASAMLSGATLHPVQLYKVGESYFVLDGNHRVSAAKVLGMYYIDAEVVEFYSCGLWASRTNEMAAAAA